MRTSTGHAALAFGLLLAACGPSETELLTRPPGGGPLTGPDTLVSGRILDGGANSFLPPSTVVVELSDVSFADGPADLVARQILEDVVAFPIPYTLTGKADEAFANTSRRLAVSATVFLADDREVAVGDYLTETTHIVPSTPTTSFDVQVTKLEHCSDPEAGGFCTTRVR